MTIYPLPSGAPTTGIWSGPDGRLWFTRTDIDAISAFDPETGTASDYPLPGHDGTSTPNYLALGSDGSIWATEFGGGDLLHVTGTLTETTPTVEAVAPGYGPTTGGTTVTISGTDLGGATAVRFGNAGRDSVTNLDPAHVTAVAPAGSGTVDVTVVTAHGNTPTVAADRFTYGTAPSPAPTITGITPSTGPASGGSVITVTGTELSGATITVGGTAAIAVSCTATACTATTPGGAAGAADVVAHGTGGASATSVTDRFTYLTPPPPGPQVTGISPTSGPQAGGTTLTVTGTGLAGGIVAVGLNSVPATCTATTCTLTTPPGGLGTVHVRVSTAGGTSAATGADVYTYELGTPSAPGQPKTTAGNEQVEISWSAPTSPGDSPITGYVVTGYVGATVKKTVTVGTVLAATPHRADQRRELHLPGPRAEPVSEPDRTPRRPRRSCRRPFHPAPPMSRAPAATPG